MEQILTQFMVNETDIYMLIFIVLIGFVLISKVPAVLHTPLMSGANAISGIVIIGGILLIKTAEPGDNFSLIAGALSIILGMINVAGGFAVTNRMLEMFKKEPKK